MIVNHCLKPKLKQAVLPNHAEWATRTTFAWCLASVEVYSRRDFCRRDRVQETGAESLFSGRM